MTLALLLLGLVLGWLAQRFSSLPASAPSLLNAYIINIALPAMILLKVPLLTLSATALIPAIAAWSVILVSALSLVFLARWLRWPKEVLGALLLVVPLSNSSYLGLPLLDALRGEEVVAYAAIYDQLGNFLALALYAPMVVALVGTGEQSFSVKQVLLSLVRFIPFPILLLALFVLTPGMLPDLTHAPLSFLSKTMAPVAAFIVGFALRFSVPAALLQPLAIGLSMRLLGAPLLVLGLFQLISVTEAVRVASVMEAAMPCMITAGLVGIAAGFSERLVVAMLAYSTALGLFTVWALDTLL